MSNKSGFDLRTFIFIDQMQPQLAQFIAKDNRVYDPKEYDAAIMLELAPAMEIHRMIDLALKATNVRLGSVVTERVFGLMQIQHEDQGEVIEAGEAVLRQTGLVVASGTNLDDLSDYRPGLIAAEERQVCHPYIESGIDKAGLRLIAAELGLDDLKDLPAAPCLSSRVTTGIGIDAKLLPLVDEAERGVWRLLDEQLEMTGVRCRILEAAVAIQIEAPAPLDLAHPALAEAEAFVKNLFVSRGYANQVLKVSVEPYKKGSAFLVDVVEVNV